MAKHDVLSNPEIQHAVLVLAAGESKRYGSAKQLALIDGIPMIRHVLMNVIDPDHYHVIVVLGAHSEIIRPEIKDLPVEIVVNDGWKTGMASSLQCGRHHVQHHLPEVTALVVLAGDQYLMTREHFRLLIKESQKNPDIIIAANYDGHPGIPVCFPRLEWELFSMLQGDEGAKDILKKKSNVKLIELYDARRDKDFPD